MDEPVKIVHEGMGERKKDGGEESVVALTFSM